MSNNRFFAAAFSVSFVGGDARHDVSTMPVGIASRPAQAGSAWHVARVETKPFATIYELACKSGGQPIRVEVSTRGRMHRSVAAGTTVRAIAVTTGVVLEAAGDAIAFIPNALGRAVFSERARA